jgi:dTDP-4-dehydrorhamnose reductase
VSKNHEVYSGINQHTAKYGVPIKFDVSNKEQVNLALRKVKPEVVVHAASLTDVDKCELNRELCLKINVEGTENVVKAAKKNRAYLFYISTDYIFNGEKGYYKETDPPYPINFYGHTKLLAEEKVMTNLDDFCIARPSVIYGIALATGKTNFALWLHNKLKKGEQVKIATDQWNSPTLNTSLAEMTLEIIQLKKTGIYHLAGATRLSRFNFAKLLAETFGYDDSLITPITSAQLRQAAKRPKDSSLNTQKAEKSLKNKPLRIEQAFNRLKQELKNA